MMDINNINEFYILTKAFNLTDDDIFIGVARILFNLKSPLKNIFIHLCFHQMIGKSIACAKYL